MTVGRWAGSVHSAGATSRDKLQYLEREDDPRNVAMRRGKGFALAPFFSLHKWFFDGTSFGSSETWSESVGAQLRYQVGPVGGFLLEAGYEHFNATSLDPFTIGGLTSQLAFEARFPLDPEYDNQLFLAPGLGYEHITFSPSSGRAQFDPGQRSRPAPAVRVPAHGAGERVDRLLDRWRMGEVVGLRTRDVVGSRTRRSSRRTWRSSGACRQTAHPRELAMVVLDVRGVCRRLRCRMATGST